MFLSALITAVAGTLLLWGTAERSDRFVVELEKAGRSSVPWRLSVSTGIKTIGGLHRVEDLHAEIQLDGESEPQALTAQAIQPPAWGERVQGVQEEVVVRLETHLDPSWIGRQGRITYTYTLVWPQMQGDSVERMFARDGQFAEKSERVRLQRNISFVERTGGWLRKTARLMGYVFIVAGGFALLGAVSSFWRRRTTLPMPPTSTNVTQLPEFREKRRRVHRRRARWWIVGMLLANGLVGIAVVWGLIRAAQVGAASVFISIFGLAWAIAAFMRARYAREKRKAEGYAQPFADEVLQDPDKAPQPFALFLRSFEMEKESNLYRGANEDAGAADATLEARSVENAIVAVLNLPIVGLADPREPEPMPGVHRFSQVPEDWLSLIHRLVRDSKLIVMHLTSLTPGIVTEIEHVRTSGNAAKTLIVIGRGVRAVKAVAEDQLRDLISTFPNVVREQLGPTWSRAEERTFQTRLVAALTRIEHVSPGKSFIQNRAELPLTIPHFAKRVMRFVLGPLITVVVLYALLGFLGLCGLWDGSLSPEQVRRNMLKILPYLPAAVLFFAVAKGGFLIIRGARARGKAAGQNLADKLFPPEIPC